MNICTLSWYRLSEITRISTLILFLFVNNGHTQEFYRDRGGFDEAELAQLLAPIALYPDSLLTHILIASTYPVQLVQASRWRSQNHHFTANQAMKKAENKNWDPSVIALLAFPNLLERLSTDLDWTQKLGDAFLENEAAVLTTIQSLRRQADQADSLSKMDNMSVTRIEGQVVIEPVEKGVVYIPCYDPMVVYGHWHWYGHPPVSWYRYPYYMPSRLQLFYWSHGVHITFNYYFSAFNWHKQHLVVISHQNSHLYRAGNRIATSRGVQHWKHKYPYQYGRESYYYHLRPEINSSSSGRAHSGGQRANTAERLKKYPDTKRKVHSNYHFPYPYRQGTDGIKGTIKENTDPFLFHKQHKTEQTHQKLREEVMRQNSSGYREKKKIRE